MFAEMLFSDDKMPSRTLVESQAAKIPDFGGTDEEKGATAKTLSMAVEKIDVMIENTSCMLIYYEGGEAGINNLYLCDMIESSGMRSHNIDIKVRNEWDMFSVPALYDDSDGGETNVMLFQGQCFDRCVLEEGGIINRYACLDCYPVVSGSNGPITGAGACS